MKVTEYEMRGLLTGKCVPADMLVNEELPAYLVRKFAALNQQLSHTESQLRESSEKLDAVLAENVALKSGVKYFSYSEFSGFEEHATAKLAMESADSDLAGERDEASSEGWSEETSTICWGIICQKAVEDKFEQPSEENGWVGWSDFTLTPSLKTPATDAILNEVRAEALIKFAEEADRKAEAFDASARESDGFNEDQRFRYVAAMFRGFAKKLRAGSTEGGV